MKRSGRGDYSSAISILAPKSVVEQAKLEAEQTAESRSRQRQRAEVQRARREQHNQAETKAKMLALFPSMPVDEAEETVAHAFEVGSGRVGRTKITLAVIAMIRHRHTEYDCLLADGCNRDVAREAVFPQVNSILARWRQQPEGDQDGSS
jgi:hypothetical protein